MASNTNGAVGTDFLECKTLNQCYPDLVRCIQQAPNDIADHLRPLNILAQGDVNFLQDPHNSKDDKARRIVDVVLKQVQSNTEVYKVFVKALKQYRWTEAAVRKLEEAQTSLGSVASMQCLPEETSAGIILC